MRVGRRISVTALNTNINADLDLGAAHGLNTDWIDTSSIITHLELRGGAGVLSRENSVSSLWLCGGDVDGDLGAQIIIMGNGSQMEFYVDNAGNVPTETMRLEGDVTPPYLDMLSHRIAAISDATTAGDALNYQAWGSSASITHTWGGGTPVSWSYTFRYTKIGKTCYYSYQGAAAADSNATTSLILTDLPYTSAAINFLGQWINGTGAGGTTFNDILGYVAGSTKQVSFAKWVTPTDGQPLYVQGTGFYEVA